MKAVSPFLLALVKTLPSEFLPGKTFVGRGLGTAIPVSAAAYSVERLAEKIKGTTNNVGSNNTGPTTTGEINMPVKETHYNGATVSAPHDIETYNQDNRSNYENPIPTDGVAN